MSSERSKGFVIGFDGAAKAKIVWKVRVSDSNSPYNGQKLVVASIHGGLELAKGLNVDFVIGTVDDSLGKKALRAVDVRLEVPEENNSDVNRSKGAVNVM